MPTYCTVHVIAKNKASEFLILQRAEHRSSPGTWNCVTGYIQERESAEAAAIRELKEETNLEGILLKVGEPHWSDHEEDRFVIVPVLIEVQNENELKIDEYESSARAWVTVDDKRVQGKESLLESLRKVNQE